MIAKTILEDLYLINKKSMQEIADILGCSLHKVAYWMEKHRLQTRPRSEAAYIKYNPGGDPFHFRKPKTREEVFLMGLGLGLYWGEGTKANKNSVRLGNTDPDLINRFIDFLIEIYGVKKSDLKFGLQIFNDVNSSNALRFWMKKLSVERNQFHKKVVVTPSRSKGTYKRKSEYGVLTVYYNNTKLRGALGSELGKLRY